MGNTSEIQWTDATWNIARGCKKVDADCKYCYMYRQSLNNTRYQADQVIRTKTVFTLPCQ
jgi:protein gp37